MNRNYILIDENVNKLSEDMFTGMFKDVYSKHIKDKPVGNNVVVHFNNKNAVTEYFSIRREYGDLTPTNIYDLLQVNKEDEIVYNCKNNEQINHYSVYERYYNTTDIKEWDTSWFNLEYLKNYTTIFSSIHHKDKLLFTNLNTITQHHWTKYRLKDLATIKHIR